MTTNNRCETDTDDAQVSEWCLDDVRPLFGCRLAADEGPSDSTQDTIRSMPHELFDVTDGATSCGSGALDPATATGFRTIPSLAGARNQTFWKCCGDVELLIEVISPAIDRYPRSRYTFHSTDSLWNVGEGRRTMTGYEPRAGVHVRDQAVPISVCHASLSKVELNYPDAELVVSSLRATEACANNLETLNASLRHAPGWRHQPDPNGPEWF